MPNKRIQDLPKIDQLTSGDIFPLGRASASYDAYGVTGQQLTDFIKAEAQTFVDAAEKSATEAESSKIAAAQSVTQANAAKDAADLAKTGAETAKSGAESAQAAAEESRQAIENMTVSAQEVGSDQPVAVQKTIVEGVVNLLFSLKAGPTGAEGPKGDPGSSIQKIERTSGTGAPGTTDTYTITLTDGSTSTFTVYNGANGEGAGDMVAAIYDPTGKATDIYAYVDDKIAEIPTPDVSGQIGEHNTSPDAHQDIRNALNAKPSELYVYDGESKSLGLKALNSQIGYLMISGNRFLQITNAAAYGDLIKFTSNDGMVSGLKDPENEEDASNKRYVDSSKISKVADATEGNLAILASDGGIQDSGKALDDLGGMYVVEIGGVVPDGPYEVNKSVAEIQAAYNAGKSVVAKVQYKNSLGNTLTTSVPLTNVTSEVATFSKVLGNVMYLANLTISWNGTGVLASFAESHSHKADDIVQTSLITTDIQNIRVRGMSFSSTTPSSVSNGCLVGVYE